jgi:4-hydroxy-2-oxoglutarate aldolase
MFQVPTVAFFDSSDEVDIPTTERHAIRLAQAGITGIVTHGSNGDEVRLAHQEPMTINTATREALDSTSRQDMPLITGCGTQSTRETV